MNDQNSLLTIYLQPGTTVRYQKDDKGVVETVLQETMVELVCFCDNDPNSMTIKWGNAPGQEAFATEPEHSVVLPIGTIITYKDGTTMEVANLTEPVRTQVLYKGNVAGTYVVVWVDTEGYAVVPG